MNSVRRRLITASTLGVAAWGASAPLCAQEWPSKPIRVIVPYPAGGNADSACRVLAEAIAPSLKQTMLIDNRPGASTILGTEMIARAPNDGYTIGLITDSHAINQALSRTSRGAELLGAKVPYDAVKDFTPICGIAQVPLVLVVNPALPVRTVRELVALAATRKDKGMNFGTMGTGSPWYLHMHQLRKLFGAELVDVPYKGLAPAATDLVGGTIDVMVMPIHYAQQFLKTGRLVPLATMGAQRHPLLPDVPTLAQAGYPGLELSNWFGMVAPAGTPAPIIERLGREYIAALKTDAVREKFNLTGDPYPADAAEVAARLRRDIDVYGEVIRANVS